MVFGVMPDAVAAQMVAVIIPAKTVVHVNGTPVYLAVDTIVETAYGNMQLLTGHHYAALPVPPPVAPQPTYYVRNPDGYSPADPQPSTVSGARSAPTA